ncbi:hypothetical protein AB0F43_04750 [Kribbella sp. NPDC023972]|uniref:hypothetical protein n=1 Tax=Kribbella sp. NPDC023972 TaxID=3154795 RepID=UPI00340D550B
MRVLVRTADAPDNAGMPPEQAAEPFVVKRRGLGTTKTALYFGTLLFGLMVLLTVVMVVVQLLKGGSVREPLETVWLSWGGMPLIFAVGLPVLLLVGVVTAFEESREADDEDVLLTIDETGIYLGGEQPRTIPWPAVRGVCRIERHDVNPEGESWDPYLVVLLHDDDSLPRNSKAWGPSCPWPGTFELLGRELPYDDLAAAVTRYAPHVQVTDRGRVPD